MWTVIGTIIAAIVGGCVGVLFTLIIGKLEISKKTNIINWLFYAVAEAESIYGEGTGKLKLHYVYDKFVQLFPDMKNKISFDTFSMWVDEALEAFKQVLETNDKIAEALDIEEHEEED